MTRPVAKRGVLVEEERISCLNRAAAARGSYVLYWMQASQRACCNHALAYASAQAGERDLPLVVFFGLTADYPGANLRHYRFMLEGLAETGAALAERGIALVVRQAQPPLGAVELSRHASLVVTDRGYLRLQRQWREEAATRISCPLIQVESDVVVPVETVSPKEEYSAATLRPKMNRLLERFLVPLPETWPRKSSLPLGLQSLDLSDMDGILESLDIDRGVSPACGTRGGTSQAQARLKAFIESDLDRYGEEGNDPARDRTSRLSAYLHFGQISPLQVALAVMEAGGAGAAAYLEEIIVRRELSANFVFYNPGYDSLLGLPAWAFKTLREHAHDAREHTYSLPELEEARTHDPCWNAAQKEMVATGRMHNYMRMYWGKKMIEWSATPEDACKAAIRLNDRYELDGRDPNGYAGVMWCFGKHDRAWKERPVLGKLRYMSEGGLRRKFDIDAYVRRCEEAYARYTDTQRD